MASISEAEYIRTHLKLLAFANSGIIAQNAFRGVLYPLFKAIRVKRKTDW